MASSRVDGVNSIYRIYSYVLSEIPQRYSIHHHVTISFHNCVAFHNFKRDRAMNKKIFAHNTHAGLAKQLLGGLLSVTLLFSQTVLADEDSDVILSFSTVGDSREDPTTPDLSAQNAIWLQNTKAWSRIIQEIGQQKPKMLFFNGDMIMGYGNADPAKIDISSLNGAANSDFVKYYQQYGFWRGMVASLMENGTYVVPVPGNHEVQVKKPAKKALETNENVWRANMGDLIIDQKRFAELLGQPAENFSGDLIASDLGLAYPGLDDGINTSQKQLSYSFDVKDSHFVIINTDPVGKDSNAPTAWLSKDLAAASDRGQKHFFVFGHKPAYPYVYMTGVAPSGMTGASAQDFWNLIETYQATYFCGHEHIFNMSQPASNAWQIIVGSGGSPFDAAPTDITANPMTDRTYAWATVKIRANGNVDIDAYGFNDSYGPTHKIQHVTLKAQENKERHH